MIKTNRFVDIIRESDGRTVKKRIWTKEVDENGNTGMERKGKGDI